MTTHRRILANVSIALVCTGVGALLFRAGKVVADILPGAWR